ncbi:MAG: archaetidylserine decarboxylase [Pseudomonadota bacterium]
MGEQNTHGRIGETLALLQYFLPQHLLTGLTGWLMRRRSRWLKNAMIRGFAKLYDINTAEAAGKVPDDYDTLNAFFTRALADDARDIEHHEHALISPCDGVISACGHIENGTLLQAKGHRYHAAEFLQHDELAAAYDGGRFVTVYLSPRDYHRVHFPIAGEVSQHRAIDGQLFAVNGATARAIPNLFSRNARHVMHLQSSFGPLSMVMVGALNVASITLPWKDHAGYRFEKADTAGWFNMGSTVVLLLPNGWELDSHCETNATVKLGQALAHWRT